MESLLKLFRLNISKKEKDDPKNLFENKAWGSFFPYFFPYHFKALGGSHL